MVHSPSIIMKQKGFLLLPIQHFISLYPYLMLIGTLSPDISTWTWINLILVSCCVVLSISSSHSSRICRKFHEVKSKSMDYCYSLREQGKRSADPSQEPGWKLPLTLFNKWSCPVVGVPFYFWCWSLLWTASRFASDYIVDALKGIST